MSYTSLLGVTPNKRPQVLAEFHNSHGWSPSIWQRLIDYRFGFDGYIFTGPWLDRLWRDIEERPEWEQAPLVLTFDTGVIPSSASRWAAEMLEEFDQRLPAPLSHVNHVPAVAQILHAAPPDTPWVGIWGTSVTDNPFDPWNEDADDLGSGIPITEMYVLERHRGLIASSTSHT